jgi:hypothetical protein
MILHEHDNEGLAMICNCCNVESHTYQLLESVNIQNVKWFVVQFFCEECGNIWLVWDSSYPIGGDMFYKFPYTWDVPIDAG